MRRIFIAIALFILTISIAMTEFTLVDKSFKRCVSALDTAQFYISQKKYKEALSIIEIADNNWENTKKKLNIFLMHEDVEQIGENIKELCEYAKTKDSEDFVRLCDKTKRQLLKLKLNELPNLQNVL